MQFKKNNGLTLIELLVALGVATIGMLILGDLVINSFKEQKRSFIEARLKADIKYAFECISNGIYDLTNDRRFYGLRYAQSISYMGACGGCTSANYGGKKGGENHIIAIGERIVGGGQKQSGKTEGVYYIAKQGSAERLILRDPQTGDEFVIIPSGGENKMVELLYDEINMSVKNLDPSQSVGMGNFQIIITLTRTRDPKVKVTLQKIITTGISNSVLL